jgi:hypothetical protein
MNGRSRVRSEKLGGEAVPAAGTAGASEEEEEEEEEEEAEAGPDIRSRIAQAS